MTTRSFELGDYSFHNWSLCEYNISVRSIELLNKSRFTLNQLSTMDEIEFNSRIGSTKKSLFNAITLAIKEMKEKDKYNSISIFSLIEEGVSHYILKCFYDNEISVDMIVNLSVDELMGASDVGHTKIQSAKRAAKNIFSQFKDDETNNQTFFDVNNPEIIEKILREIESLDGVSCLYLSNKLSIDIDNIEDIIDLMLRKRMICYSPFGLTKFSPTLSNCINNILDERKKEITILRLQGWSLETIGSEFGLTRERIRQIVKKTINFPKIEEDKYSTYFESFSFTKELFCELFKEKDEVYYYLNERYKKGVIEPSLEDIKKFSIDCSHYVQKKENENYLFVDGNKISKDKSSIIEYLLPHLGTYFTSKKFIDVYENFLNMYLPNEINDFKINQRSLETYYYNYGFINCYVKGFKYLVVDDELISALVNSLNLTLYSKTIITTKKLYNENKEILHALNIMDEYELHNVLKIGIHFKKSYDIDMKFLRMPGLQFGEVDKYSIIKQAIYDVSPMDINEFCELMELEYGFKQNTFMSYITTTFPEFINERKIEANIETPNKEYISFLKTKLTDDFYFLDDYTNLLEQNKLSSNYLTKQYIHALGYTKFSSYILSSKHGTATNYFKNLILSKDIFDISKIDSRYKLIMTFTETLYSLERKHTIFEFSKSKYITINRLESRAGINKNDIEEYIANILSLVSDDFFTINLLRDIGFNEFFKKYGFEDVIYKSLFRKIPEMRTVIFEGNYIFKLNPTELKKTDFIEYVINSKRAMSIYELSDYLLDYYSIECDLSNLVTIIKTCNLYYNNDMEKVYIDYDQFIEEM